MAKLESGFFWGVLAGVAAVAIAGAMALTCSFRGSKDGGGTWESVPQGRSKPGPGRAKAGGKKRVRPSAAKK
jgi:hypothetical protein